MKIGFVGDWHGNTSYARQVIRKLISEDVSAIYHVGDFGIWNDSKSEQFFSVVSAELKGINLYVTPGNHEDYRLFSKSERTKIRDNIIVLTRGEVFEVNGVTLMSLGGAVSVDKDWRVPGVSWFPEESLSFNDCEHAMSQAHKEVDIMICHDVPAGFDIEAIEGNPFGFPDHAIRSAEENRDMLRAVVDQVQPELIVSGHYHTRESGVLQGETYSTQIEILDCDGAALWKNYLVVDLDDFAKN